MELTVNNIQNSAASKVTVADVVFAQAYNEPLVHQVIVAYQAGGRSGSRKQKTRAEVAGSTRKLWKQKGTGQARVGNGKCNVWRKGGVAFAARPQDHSQKVNKKMYRGALRAILSELIRQNRLQVFEQLTVEQPKTKQLAALLTTLNLDKVMIVTDQLDANLYLAARNLPHVSVRDVSAIDPVSLLHFDQIVMTKAALKQLEERLA